MECEGLKKKTICGKVNMIVIKAVRSAIFSSPPIWTYGMYFMAPCDLVVQHNYPWSMILQTKVLCDISGLEH